MSSEVLRLGNSSAIALNTTSCIPLPQGNVITGPEHESKPRCFLFRIRSILFVLKVHEHTSSITKRYLQFYK